MTSWASNARSKVRDRWNESFEDADLSWLFWFVAFLAFIIFAWMCRYIVQSVEPFTAIAGGTIPRPSNLWFIGWIFDAAKTVGTATIAIFIWAVVNFVEIFWVIVLTNRQYHRTKRRKLARVIREQTDNDIDLSNRVIRKAKRRELKAYTWVEDWMIPAALGALVFDTLVNWRRYPVITDWSAFEVGLSLEKIQGVNWDNAAQMLVNLTLFEVFAIAFIFCVTYLKDCLDGDEA